MYTLRGHSWLHNLSLALKASELEAGLRVRGLTKMPVLASEAQAGLSGNGWPQSEWLASVDIGTSAKITLESV